jgi:hypothetical protein
MLQLYVLQGHHYYLTLFAGFIIGLQAGAYTLGRFLDPDSYRKNRKADASTSYTARRSIQRI